MRVRELTTWLAAASLVVLTCGCGVETEVANLPGIEKALDTADELVDDVNAEEAEMEKIYRPSGAPASKYVFEAPVRIKAGDEYVSVESPGYACPTMADVDGDGLEDLVVGQFQNGAMQFCKNIARSNETPRFAKAEWLKTGDKRAEVPGVW